MSDAKRMRLHNSLVAGCALAAIALLFTFYSVVSGAVSHAAFRRIVMSAPALEATGLRAVSLRKQRAVVVAGVAD